MWPSVNSEQSKDIKFREGRPGLDSRVSTFFEDSISHDLHRLDHKNLMIKSYVVPLSEILLIKNANEHRPFRNFGSFQKKFTSNKV